MACFLELVAGGQVKLGPIITHRFQIEDAAKAYDLIRGEARERYLGILLEYPRELADVPLRIDIARTIFRPHTAGPAAGQNFLFDSASGCVRPLVAYEFYRRLPISHRLCRVYAHSSEHAPQIAAALDTLLGGVVDDMTNM